MNNNSSTTKVDTKRTLPSTLTLIAIMLATSARDAAEKAMQPICESLLQLDHDAIGAQLQILLDQGYLAQDGDVIRLTGFGEKVALQATQNTPNFNRLAKQNANTAFAMMFAGYTALKEEHLREQQHIVAGANGSTLVDNLKGMIEFFQSKLEEEVVTTKKSKKAVAVAA